MVLNAIEQVLEDIQPELERQKQAARDKARLKRLRDGKLSLETLQKYYLTQKANQDLRANWLEILRIERAVQRIAAMEVDEKGVFSMEKIVHCFTCVKGYTSYHTRDAHLKLGHNVGMKVSSIGGKNEA